MNAMDTSGLFSSRVLTDMRDGVMVIDHQGQIVVFNHSAEQILGLCASDVLGCNFAEVFLVREGSDDFNQAVLDAIAHRGVAQLQVVTFTPDGATAPLSLSLTTSFLHGEGSGAERTAAGVIVVFDDITELQTLQAEQVRQAQTLQAQHQELQKAYRSMEDGNRQLADALRQVRSVRRLGAVFAGVLVLGLGGVYAWQGHLLSGGQPTAPSLAVPAPIQATPYTVHPQPLSVSLSLTGRLSPLQTVNVPSPLSGRIAQVMVQQGDTVQAGQALVRLDTSEVEVKLREARTAVIKAEETLNQFENWDHSPDVTRARRMLTKSRMALDAQKKALDEAERLFGKGIIAANEVESVRQQHASQLLDHQSVEEELAAILARGASTQRQIARLELDTQRQRLRQHEAELAQAVVRSPVAGIVMRPAVSGSNKPNKQVSAGETFGQGELLLAVGDLKGLTVAARVGEVEVTQLKPGQAVTVSGDAFPGVQLHGTLRSVAPQADDTETRGLPVFQIQVSVDELTAAQRQQVWVGMSASLSVQVLKREAALMVPLSAVQQDPSGAWVWVQPTGEVGARKQSVQTGHTTPDSVEITSGLQAGNVVWLGRPNGQIAQQPGQH